MNTSQLIRAFGLILFLLTSSHISAQGQFLRSESDLGDPRGYCIDIPGWGKTIDLDAPTVAHSCKYGNPFVNEDGIVAFKDGLLRMPNYDRCLSATSFSAGAKVHTVECDDAHQWTISKQGRVSPLEDGSICLTFDQKLSGPVYSVPALAPEFKARKLSLETCSESAYPWQNWRWSDSNEFPEATANTMLIGMSPKIAKAIQTMGNDLDAKRISQIYQGEQRMFSARDLHIHEGISYGKGKDQVLDIYQNKAHRTPGGSPVIVIVDDHDPAINLSNVATHFSGLGFVSVHIRTQDSSGETIADIIKWAQENIKDYDGSPQWINLLGYKAGGTQVASYLLQSDHTDRDTSPLKAAILASPTLDSDNNLAANIQPSALPLLITMAEMDSKDSYQQTISFYAELLKQPGPTPRLRQMPVHNSISYMASVGTDDKIFIEEALDFIMRAAKFQIGDH